MERREREGGRACWEKYQCRGLAGVSVERGVPVVQTDYSQVIYIPSLDCLVILPSLPPCLPVTYLVTASEPRPALYNLESVCGWESF